MKPIIYTLDCCPHCEQLKEALDEMGIDYEERNMQTAEAITEMRVNGCFAIEAPVLQYGESFGDSSVIFKRGTVDMQYVRGLINDET